MNAFDIGMIIDLLKEIRDELKLLRAAVDRKWSAPLFPTPTGVPTIIPGPPVAPPPIGFGLTKLPGNVPSIKDIGEELKRNIKDVMKSK